MARPARPAAPAARPSADLLSGFVSPPASARPWVYWFWLNGNITREGITADLEAMRRAGIGAVVNTCLEWRGPVAEYQAAGIEDFFHAGIYGSPAPPPWTGISGATAPTGKLRVSSDGSFPKSPGLRSRFRGF